MSEYVDYPKSVEEFVGNARFQLENTEGYLQSARARHEDLNAARIKAGCLVRASEALLAKLEAECRVAANPPEPTGGTLVQF